MEISCLWYSLSLRQGSLWLAGIFQHTTNALSVRRWPEKPIRIVPIVAPHSHRHVVPIFQATCAFSQDLAHPHVQEHSLRHGTAIMPGCLRVRYDPFQKESKKSG
ncbi:MAG: hypothetical protein H0U76_21415 [Ktedonobacteraceae bacterium]|nr:hypothetical protein [Ktedonobacteraceae bacterium]